MSAVSAQWWHGVIAFGHRKSKDIVAIQLRTDAQWEDIGRPQVSLSSMFGPV